jgi:Protein of unknown function (DUF3108)
MRLPLTVTPVPAFVRAPGRPAALLALAVAAGLAAPARAANVDVAYDISLLGLPIGSATLSGDVGSERYSLEVRAKLTGLAGGITGGRGAGTATGVTAGGAPVTSSFAVTAANSSEQRTVRMNIERNAVAGSDIAPPLEERPDRVPVTDMHKKGVVDPISALMMPVSASDPRTACNRTIPVFDGAARYDITLSYGGTKQVTSEGYEGQAVACNVRYTPIAGHRNRKPVRFMAENKDIQLWLAPVSGTKLMLPFRIAVKTMIGTAVIEATRYVVDSATTATVKSSPKR